MTYSAEQLIATHQTNIELIKGLTSRAYVSFEKLIDLNLAASKAVVADAFNHTQSLLGAKTPQELIALQVGLIKPLTEKSAAYSHHVYNVASASGTEVSKAFETKLSEAQTAFADFVEKMTANAPAGTELAVAAFKNAMSTSRT